jgi:hypothetical protein
MDDFLSSPASSTNTNPFASDPSSVDAPPPVRRVPASTVQAINIRHHVPETLNFEESNFSTWQTFFNVTFRKLGLTDHVSGRFDAQLMVDDVEWSQIDQCIVSWLYTTVSRPILAIVIKPSDTAANVGKRIHDLFLDNCMQRAVFAKREFYELRQGDLSITAFSSQLKQLSDILRDVGAPVTEQDLLLAFLNGLSDDYGHCISGLTVNPLGLTFERARSVLLQEERRLGRTAQVVSQTALYAGGPSSAPAPAPPPAKGNGWRGKKKKQPKPAAATPAAPAGARPAAPVPPYTAAPSWPTGAYPISGMFQAQAWSPSWRAPGQGILGPCPTAPTPHAYSPILHELNAYN